MLVVDARDGGDQERQVMLHELAVQHHLPFLIAAVPSIDDEHVGLIVEIAGSCDPVSVAIMIREIADGLDGMNR